MIDQWLHTYVLYITRLGFSPTVVFGVKPPTTTVGDIQDPSHSVLLPSEPIERPSQHKNIQGGYSCIFLFLVWFFSVSYLSEGRYNPSIETYSWSSRVCVLPIYMYPPLYICIHTLTSRSQLPPFLSWFDYLDIFMYSPHMLTHHDMQDAQEDAIRT